MLTFEKSAGAIVFRQSEEGVRFLLLQYIEGHWGFPKGHIENNETDEETLKRETLEETGIADLEIIPNFKKTNWYFYRAKSTEKEKRVRLHKELNILKKVTFYLAQTKTKGIKLSDEHQNYVWLGYDEALEKITFWNAKKAFKKAYSFLKI